MQFLLDTVETPVGQLFLVTDEQGALRALDFEDYRARLERLLDKYYRHYQLDPLPGSAPEPLIQALTAYFHRVIGASGKLTGYGGGLWRKHWLLEHEARHSDGGAAFALV